MLKHKGIITVLFICILLLASYFIFVNKQPPYMKTRELSDMDYNNVQLATRPQAQLWTLQQAETISKQAFDLWFIRVKDEKAMLTLVKQAFQWDKNAMLQYAKILDTIRNEEPEETEGMLTLGQFLIKYSHELVDNQGKRLDTPALFDLKYREFVKVLADKKYAIPSAYMSAWTMGSEAQRNDLIFYIKNSLNGGYKYQDFLADTIIWGTGYPYKNNNPELIYKLPEHLPNITDKELKEAITNYKVSAIHGDHYSMMRIAEFYYYGIGEQQDYLLALAWAELSNESYNYPLERITDKYSDKIKEQATNNCDLALANQIKEKLTPEQQAQVKPLLEQLRTTIKTWDYDTWVNDVHILPQP